MSVAMTGGFRLVDRYTVHAGAAPLEDRIEQIVPSDAQYVVFDLDRTVHLGITIGECLGWEIISDPRGSSDDQLQPGYITWSNPLKSSVRLSRGVSDWGIPGLVYALTVKLGDRFEAWHRTMVKLGGPDYVGRMQTLLRESLMANAAGYTHAELARYAERAWERWQRRLVVTRESIAEIRRHCPELRGVILSSASTEPTVEQAAKSLGFDAFISSGVDIVDQAPRGGPGEQVRDLYTGPSILPRWLNRRRPDFLSRPGAVVHNAAENKVRLLRMRYPEIFAPDAVSVAISDNNYGEDRDWSNHFSSVVAINSRHPYSPFVAHNSPCRSIHALDARPPILDGTPKGIGNLVGREFDPGALADRLGDELRSRLADLCGALDIARAGASDTSHQPERRSLARLESRASELVREYNRAAQESKQEIRRELGRIERSARRLRSNLVKASGACARMEAEIELLRATMGRMVAERTGSSDGSDPSEAENAFA